MAERRARGGAHAALREHSHSAAPARPLERCRCAAFRKGPCRRAVIVHSDTPSTVRMRSRWISCLDRQSRRPTMRTFTSLALVAALGLGAATLGKPADAAVAVGVGVGLPGVAVGVPAPAVAPVPVVYRGYYRYPHVYPRWRYGYGYGWRRGWYRGRYWR